MDERFFRKVSEEEIKSDTYDITVTRRQASLGFDIVSAWHRNAGEARDHPPVSQCYS
jgi:hypothetical protein